MSRSECMVESGISLQDERPESSLMPSDDKCMEELDRILGIVHGAPFTEKKSTFQAHLSSVTRVDQVETVMEALLGNRKIAGATHNIMAYRINIPEKGTNLNPANPEFYNAKPETASELGSLLAYTNVVNLDIICEV
eukprot:Gb_27694 [translate_table: standard]